VDSNQVEEKRRRIDAVDDAIAQLLVVRLTLGQETMNARVESEDDAKAGSPYGQLIDIGRERAIIRRIGADPKLGPYDIRAIWTEFFRAVRGIG
jgi:chorismate mutase